MKCLKYVLAFVLALAQSSSAQLASVVVWHNGLAPYVGSKTATKESYGFYASNYEGRTLMQIRRGLDGRSVTGVFAGRNLVGDSYHKNLFVFLSGGMLMGEVQKGPSLELLITKMTINEGLTTEFRSQYGWGAFGTQNIARSSLMSLLKLGDLAYVGVNGEALYRPRSGVMKFESADAGPVLRIRYGPAFFQIWHHWDLNGPKVQKLTISIGLNQ